MANARLRKDVPCDADRADVRHYSNVSRIRANELVPQGGMQRTLLLILTSRIRKPRTKEFDCESIFSFGSGFP